MLFCPKILVQKTTLVRLNPDSKKSDYRVVTKHHFSKKNPLQINNFKLTIFQGLRAKFSLASTLSIFCLSNQFLKKSLRLYIIKDSLAYCCIYSFYDISQALEIISWQALYDIGYISSANP